MDACVGKLLVRNILMYGRSTYEVDAIIDQADFIARTVRNEYLLRDPRGFPESVRHRLSCIEASKELQIETQDGKDTVVINQSKLLKQV